MPSVREPFSPTPSPKGAWELDELVIVELFVIF